SLHLRLEYSVVYQQQPTTRCKCRAKGVPASCCGSRMRSWFISPGSSGVWPERAEACADTQDVCAAQTHSEADPAYSGEAVQFTTVLDANTAAGRVASGSGVSM